MTRLLTASLVAVLATPFGALAQDEAFEIGGLVVTGTATPRPVDALATHVTILEGSSLRARVTGIAAIQVDIGKVTGGRDVDRDRL